MHPFYQQQDFHIRTELVEQIIFPEHLHSHAEILYVLEGENRITIGDHVYFMHRGDCAVIFPGEIHSYHSSEHNLAFLLIFDTVLSGSFQYSLKNCRSLAPHLPASSLPEDISLAVQRLSEIDLQKNLPLASAWIQVILALVFPLMKLTNETRTKSENLTYQLIHYMSEHFREPITLSSLARALHINKYYLSHTFSEKLHMSFPQYLNYLRAEYAADAIQSSQKPLAQIWEDAGFTSQRSFNRAFFESKGMSPTEYRKQF